MTDSGAGALAARWATLLLFAAASVVGCGSADDEEPTRTVTVTVTEEAEAEDRAGGEGGGAGPDGEPGEISLAKLLRQDNTAVASNRGAGFPDFAAVEPEQARVDGELYEDSIVAPVGVSALEEPIWLMIDIPLEAETFATRFALRPDPNGPRRHDFVLLLRAERRGGSELFRAELAPGGRSVAPDEPIDVADLSRLFVGLRQISGYREAYPELVLADPTFKADPRR